MRFFIIFLLILIFFSTGFSQTESDYVDLGKIEVEDTHISEIPQNINSDINNKGQSKVTFNSNAIELDSKNNVVDLTKDVSGVYYNKAGIMNFQAGVNAPSVFKIRGIGEKPNTGILTVIDDRPQSIGIWRHPLMDTLSLDSVESVEVIKGPSGVEYGNQAVGGVIHIKTKKMKQDGMKTILGLGYGSYNAQDYFVNNLFKSGKFDYNISAGYKSTSGDRKNSDSYQENYHVGIGYDLSKKWRVSAHSDYADILFFNPGETNNPLERYSNKGGGETFQRNFDIQIEHSYNKIKGKTILYADTGLNKFFKDSNNQFENYGLRIIENINFIKNNKTKVGFDWQQFGGVYDISPSGSDKKVKKYQNDYAAYFLTQQKISIIILSGGIRYTYNDLWDDKMIPYTGLKVNTFDSQYIYGNVQKGYKTPELGREFMSELFIFMPKYEVTKPEEYWQYEAGLYQLLKKFFYKIAVYQIEGENLIQTVYGKPPIIKNSGKIFIRGIEIDTYVKPVDNIKLGTLLSYLEPGSKTAHLTFFNGKVYTVFSLLKSLSIKAESEFARNRYDADEKNDKLDDYIVFNSGLYYTTQLKNIKTDFYIDFENIFNKQYLVREGYPVPGLLVKAGVLLKI